MDTTRSRRAVDNRQIVLAERPTGTLERGDDDARHDASARVRRRRSAHQGGDVEHRSDHSHLDGRRAGYLPPIQIGDVVRGAARASWWSRRTIATKVGDVVFGMTGWQEWVVADAEHRFAVIPSGLGLDLATVMNVLGVTGITAYFGMTRGRPDCGPATSWSCPPLPEPRDRSLGRSRSRTARVGSSASLGERRSAPTSSATYGFDECLDYREPRLRERVRAACPTGRRPLLRQCRR